MLAVVAAELRAIVTRDIHRRMVEGVAFQAFDQWWEEKERQNKVYRTVLIFIDIDSFFVVFDTYCS